MDTPTVSSSTTTELLAGWGGTAPSAATVRRPTTVDYFFSYLFDLEEFQ